jgi:mannose-6-phosphate isomerase-like protein (cupin superfamily)/pyrroloquinoline quinone (PQQ) biosynthesis protein C
VLKHDFWKNNLFKACRDGSLTQADFAYIFGQYAYYSKNFTRYLAGVMFSCEDDYYRSALSENLWEEGGGAEPEKRHAELFRGFLTDSLGIAQPRDVPMEDFTRVFVNRYLHCSSSMDHTYGCSFLALGTEGIVSKMYEIMVKGMHQAGIPDSDLHFFHLHIGCDDEHAETLLQMLLASRSSRPDWLSAVLRGIDDALSTRRDFFNALYAKLKRQRVDRLIDHAASRTPAETSENSCWVYRSDDLGEEMYQNANPRLNIDFSVARMDFSASETLDARTVTIAPYANNERHRHAHESIFHIISGAGEVVLGSQVIPVKAGDVAFIPRWVFHQTRNTISDPLVLLAITDFGFTSAVLGDYDRRIRLKTGGDDAG